MITSPRFERRLVFFVMDVRCDKCGTEYEFDEARIGASGVTVKCTACGFVFKVKKPEGTRSSGPAPGKPREWLVRKPDGQMIAFRELTTLQKWIVEGRIHRDDEISKNGETWKRLGNINELEPFFSVFERAKALNELMATGAIGDRPLVVNGSEVLATMSPLSSIVAASSPLPAPSVIERPQPVLPPPAEELLRAAGVQAQLSDSVPPPLPRARAAATTRTVGRSDRTRGPSLITRRPDLAGFEPSEAPPPPVATEELVWPSEARTDPPPPLHSHKGQNGHASHRASTLPLGADPSLPRISMPIPPANGHYSTGLEGPGSFHGHEGGVTSELEVPPRPRLASNESGSHIVRRFQKQRRVRRIALSLTAFVVLGLGGGAGFALLGPTSNPLQLMAREYGLLGGTVAQPPDQVAIHVEAAQRAFELDTFADLERAAKAYDQALALRKDDAAIIADLALVSSTHADALRRAAGEDEARAAKLQAENAAKNAEEIAAAKKAAEEKRLRASALMKRAFDAARSAYEKTPDALAANRALADYYRVQRDEEGRMTQLLARAKAAAQAASTTDAATLYIEAAELAKDLQQATPADLERATRLLEEALTVRPTLLRARVLLGRIMLSRGHGALASAELRRALESSPEHQEAKQLLALAAQPQAAIAAAAPKAAPAPAPAPAAVAEPAPKAAEPAPKAEPKPVESPKIVASADAIKAEEPAPKPSKSYDGLLKIADRFREKGDAWEALQNYEKATTLRPSAGRGYAGMGWSYLDLGKPEAAVHQFRKAMAVEPSFAEGHLGHAEAYRAMGNSDKALSSYQRYLELRPSGSGADAARRAIAAIEGRTADASGAEE